MRTVLRNRMPTRFGLRAISGEHRLSRVVPPTSRITLLGNRVVEGRDGFNVGVTERLRPPLERIGQSSVTFRYGRIPKVIIRGGFGGTDDREKGEDRPLAVRSSVREILGITRPRT